MIFEIEEITRKETCIYLEVYLSKSRCVMGPGRSVDKRKINGRCLRRRPNDYLNVFNKYYLRYAANSASLLSSLHRGI
jgi:hypothetical protein